MSNSFVSKMLFEGFFVGATLVVALAKQVQYR
jgi:hypothetical protein